MKKRMYLSMMVLTVISLLMVSVLLSFVFYGQFSAAVRAELRERAGMFTDNSSATAIAELTTTQSGGLRVTVVHPDGAVLYDNTMEAAGLPNHLDREEITEALTSGAGESKRFSNTLREETYYYAVRLTDGSVLRMAKTTDSIVGMFVGILPTVAGVVLAVLIAGYLLARGLTERIVEPINKVDLNALLNVPYDELAPFVGTITEQRKHIARQVADLQNRTQTISAIMDNMSEGIVLLNKQGVILSINKSAVSIFEANDGMEGKNILELLRDVELLGHVRNALAGNRGDMSLERGGKTYRVYFSPVTDSGAILLFMDITERVKAENMRREFSANVSHELKTPLTSIYGYAEMLCNGMVKENDKTGFYTKIKEEAARLIVLIEDIIMISELDEQKGDERLEEVSLPAIAAETIETLGLKAEEGQVSVRITGGDVRMHINRSRLYELLYNLIDNAIKYNRPGGSVHVDLSQTEEHIQIAVTDTGVGIPKEAEGRVFERFYRVDTSRSKTTGGTGLGLAIVKHIAMVYDGKVELDSRIGEGTTVTVTFPATPRADGELDKGIEADAIDPSGI